ncbi:urease [Aspergillus udagawae]|nr:urease [Aspergillus udagawae]
MHLIPRELDKLTIAHLGHLAQRRLSRGIRLNHAEAALIRDGHYAVVDLMSLGRSILGRRHVLPSVWFTLRQLQVEGTFPTGTYLVTVQHPIAGEEGDLGKALYGSGLPVPPSDPLPSSDQLWDQAAAGVEEWNDYGLSRRRSNGSIPTIEPMMMRPQFAPHVPRTSIMFVSQTSKEKVKNEYGLKKTIEAVKHCRTVDTKQIQPTPKPDPVPLSKKHMKYYSEMPKMEVDPETFTVKADGEVCDVAPATALPLTQDYYILRFRNRGYALSSVQM